jgi:hypothetical protein
VLDLPVWLANHAAANCPRTAPACPASCPPCRLLQNNTTVHQLGLDLWRDVVVRNRRICQRLLDMLLDSVQVRCVCVGQGGL